MPDNVSGLFAKARQIAAAATPGKWQHVTAGGRTEHYVYAPDARYSSLPGNPSPVKVAWLPWSPDGRDDRDAEHVATFDPSTVTAMLEALESAREFRWATSQTEWRRTMKDFDEAESRVRDLLGDGR